MLADKNPEQVARIGTHAVTALVAGPALIWAGLTYPGSWKARTFLTLAGVALVVTHYEYLQDELR